MVLRSLLVAVLTLPLGFFASQACLAAEGIKVQVEGDAISVYLHVPPGSGPFPVAILSHGSPREPAQRAGYGETTLAAIAKTFVARGILVAVPIRRGYGGAGVFAEGIGPCDNADYYSAGLATAQDIRTAALAVRTRRDADASRMVYVGQSAGGWGSIAAATYGGAGLLGVVNFAGGRGSRGPADVCSEMSLVTAAGRYGGLSREPQLWIYSVNDQFFGPDLAKRMHASFTAAGGKARLFNAPAHGKDGHFYYQATGSWQHEVDAFLRGVGFLR